MISNIKKRISGLPARLLTRNIIGITACFLLFSTGFLINGNIGMYFNLSALMIVLGGTLGTTLICFRLSRLQIARKVLINSYKPEAITVGEIVGILVDLSVKRKYHGLLALQDDEQESTILFLRQALGFLIDRFDPEEIREILSSEMYFFRQRREESARVLSTMAEICPSFGLVGSVVGLVGMLSGIGSTEVILGTIPVALVSTLYGIVLSNLFFQPFASNIRERTNQELLLQKIIMEGVIAIAKESHPAVLERKLKSFLTPSARKGRLTSLQRIREILKESETESPFEDDLNHETKSKKAG